MIQRFLLLQTTEGRICNKNDVRMEVRTSEIDLEKWGNVEFHDQT